MRSAMTSFWRRIGSPETEGAAGARCAAHIGGRFGHGGVGDEFRRGWRASGQSCQEADASVRRWPILMSLLATRIADHRSRRRAVAQWAWRHSSTGVDGVAERTARKAAMAAGDDGDGKQQVAPA